MIEKWNILHLRRRIDRAPFAFANAERLGVPRGIVKFWDAKDSQDFGNDAQRVIEAAVEDGFKQFQRLSPEVPPGKICQTWNVCRFLRDLADRESIEMLIHDGVMIQRSVNEQTYFYPDFQFFCEVVEECSKRKAPFKLLTVGTLLPLLPIKPISPGSLILQGAWATVNSIRVYSRSGAEIILKRILSEVNRGIYDADCMFNDTTTPTLESSCWSKPGMYTLLLQKIAMDMDRDYFGSDRQGWEKHCGVYGELLSGI